MSERETSLRESTLARLKTVFAQFLATLKDTPSKPVVERQLTEAYRNEEDAMGELCDRMEGNLRAQQESYFSAYRKAVDEVIRKVVEGLKKPGDIEVFKREFNELKLAQTAALLEMQQQFEAYVGSWHSELELGTRAIVNKFDDDAVRIVAESVLADDATAYLDPDTSPKH